MFITLVFTFQAKRWQIADDLLRLEQKTSGKYSILYYCIFFTLLNISNSNMLLRNLTAIVKVSSVHLSF